MANFHMNNADLQEAINEASSMIGRAPLNSALFHSLHAHLSRLLEEQASRATIGGR